LKGSHPIPLTVQHVVAKEREKTLYQMGILCGYVSPEIILDRQIKKIQINGHKVSFKLIDREKASIVDLMEGDQWQRSSKLVGDQAKRQLSNRVPHRPLRFNC